MTICCVFTSESVRKKFENRSTFGEVMDNIIVDCFFFDSQCSVRVYHGLQVVFIHF